MKLRCIAIALATALILCACPALGESYANACTSLYSAGSNRLNNIELAMNAINGTTVLSGETFSFNKVVGARTQARGYRSATNDRGVSVTGGGVAQVATTLYLALLDLGGDIEYNELSVYGNRFTGDYVDDGSVAVITDYSAGTDFRFTNHGDDMTIDMWENNGFLFCSVSRGSGEGGTGWFDLWSEPEAASTERPSHTYTARIQLSGDENTLNNVWLASESVNDTTLSYGDVFSFNDVVGPRTAVYGYVSGTNGRGVRVVGGGVAQVASAIWMAVKNMPDVEIKEKITYGDRYDQTYVESADDAIVTDYKAGTDFAFRYWGEGTMTVYVVLERGTLRCDVVCE